MNIDYRTKDESVWGAEFGSNLQNVIRSKKVTQSQLAKKLGITEAMLSRYIHGTAIPSTYKTCQIANALECNICELIKTSYQD